MVTDDIPAGRGQVRHYYRSGLAPGGCDLGRSDQELRRLDPDAVEAPAKFNQGGIAAPLDRSDDPSDPFGHRPVRAAAL
jgi:hypothetical protein